MPSNEISYTNSAARPPLHFHEWQPPFESEWSETQRYLEERSYMKAPRPIKIIAIGAGASLISFAREVQEGRLENVELVVYEKNPETAGTWYENTYTGVACDIPSHNYQYTWATNPDWTEYYSTGPEIKHYFQTVARKYDLEKYIKLRHEVARAVWVEEASKWEITVKCLESGDMLTDSADILINGGGLVNNWKWPSIPAIETFKGKLVHTAAWDTEYDFKDKIVVVVGNGSSGVQVTSALRNVVSKMVVVMRTPTWVTSPFAPAFAGPNGTNITYSEEQKKQWREDPDSYLLYRKQIEADLNGRSALFMKGSPEQQQAREYSYKQMANALKSKPELIKRLIPSFDVGCRRPSPGNGYLETLAEPHVEVSWGTPKCFTETSLILHDGVEIRPDIVICATGFDLSYRPRFPIVGRNGTDLGDYWTPDAKAYMSLAIPNFPNYLHYLGPATAAAHGSLIPPIEQLTKYFVRIINKIQRENYVAFEPLQKCVDELYARNQEFMRHTVWSSHCTSTFKNGTWTGKVNLLHGGSRLHYFEMLQDPRWEDYHWTVQPGHGMYDYFGTGKSKLEGTGLPTTWYLENPDATPL